MSARIGEHADRTRLVLELSDPVTLRAFSLANPNRVILDMPEVAWRMGNPPVPTGSGLIKAYRYGVFRTGNSRMVIDLNRPARLAETLVIPPTAGFGYRVVIDMFPATQTAFESDAGWPADLKKREADAERRARVANVPRANGKKVVVIDPGHGGIDSGASGVNGLLEKTLFTNVPQLLGESLQANAKKHLGDARFHQFNHTLAGAVAGAFGGDPEKIHREIEAGNFLGTTPPPHSPTPRSADLTPRPPPRAPRPPRPPVPLPHLSALNPQLRRQPPPASSASTPSKLSAPT